MTWLKILSVVAAFLACVFGVPAPQSEIVDWKAVQNRVDGLAIQILSVLYDFFIAGSATTFHYPEVDRTVSEQVLLPLQNLDTVFTALFSASKNQNLTASQVDMYFGDINNNLDIILAAVKPEAHLSQLNGTNASLSIRFGNAQNYTDQTARDLHLLLSGLSPQNVPE